MKKHSNYFVEEREIDVKKILAQFLKKWRILLLFAVIATVITVAADYKLRYKEATEASIAAADKANAAPETVASMEAQMDSTQLQRVWRYVYMTNTLEQRRNYQMESILMTINPYKEDVVNLSYKISSKDSDEAEKVAKQYVSYIESGELGAEVTAALELEMESSYVSELITTERSNQRFTVRVCGESKEACEKLADAVSEALEQYEPDMSDLENTCKLKLTDRVSDVVVDQSLADTQASFNSDLNLYVTTYNNLQNSLNDDQEKLAKMILAEGVSSKNSVLPVEVEEEEERAHVDPEPVYVSVSLSKVPLGLLTGILIAMVLILIGYSLSGGIHGMQEAKYLFEIRDMGTISAFSQKKKRIGNRLDRLADKVCMGYRNYVDYEKQMELICANVLLACQKEGIKKVCVSGSRLEKIPKEILKQMKESLAKEGITLEMEENINCNAASLRNVAEVGSCILVEADEKSNCNDIVKELNCCSENGIRLLGMVMVSNC